MAFSEIEKINIREKLMTSCEESWSRVGYKKTNIDELCAKAGISKGAFYLFFNSKEELFCDVIMSIQARLVTLMNESLGNAPTKYDLAATLKLVYREYDKVPFVFEIRSPDFIAFMNKLPKEKIDELEFHGDYDVRDILKKTDLKYKIEENKGNAAFAILFMPITEKEKLPWNYLESIDFMIDTLIENIFE